MKDYNQHILKTVEEKIDRNTIKHKINRKNVCFSVFYQAFVILIISVILLCSSFIIPDVNIINEIGGWF